MDKRILKTLFPIAAALLMAACSEVPTTLPSEKNPPAEVNKEPAKAPEPIAAQDAFWAMYKPARTWAPDLLVLSVAASELPELKNDGGKAAMWTAVFVSPSRREARTFFYSVVDSGTTLKGVSAGGAQSWSGPTKLSKPFHVSEFAVNSDAAYKTAIEKAEPWLKQHPGKKAVLFLTAADRFPAPVWYILWGDKKAGYGAFVNATTGAIMNAK